jgi:hypothetical protein
MSYTQKNIIYKNIIQNTNQSISHSAVEIWLFLMKWIHKSKQLVLKINRKKEPVARINYWEK